MPTVFGLVCNTARWFPCCDAMNIIHAKRRRPTVSRTTEKSHWDELPRRRHSENSTCPAVLRALPCIPVGVATPDPRGKPGRRQVRLKAGREAGSKHETGRGEVKETAITSSEPGDRRRSRVKSAVCKPGRLRPRKGYRCRSCQEQVASSPKGTDTPRAVECGGQPPPLACRPGRTAT